MHPSIINRLSSLGLEAWDLGGGGDCFFHCLAPLVGMSVPVFRRCVAQHMRDNEHLYGGLGNFEFYGGYQCYCDMVGRCGTYVEGNAEIAATADLISRHLLILGVDSNHDVYIFAGAIGLGAPAHLGVDESPIIIAHCHITQHYTRTRIILQPPWRAPKGLKRARSDELRRQNENQATLMESARGAVITLARSLAERARISLSEEDNANLPAGVINTLGVSVAPLITPSAALSHEPSLPIVIIVDPVTDALSPVPHAPALAPVMTALPPAPS